MEEEKIRVFCYGSNMSSKRITRANRCPSARFFCVASLKQYVFKFNKKSNFGGGSGKGNIVSTNDDSDLVWGVVFEILKSEENLLDLAEGLNGGYIKEKINVVKKDGSEIPTNVYIAKELEYLDDNELPFDWYKNHCLQGAIEFNSPKEYIDFLNSFETKIDPNAERKRAETEIYD